MLCLKDAKIPNYNILVCFFSQKSPPTGPLKLKHQVLFYQLIETKRKIEQQIALKTNKRTFQPIASTIVTCYIPPLKKASLFYSLSV